MNLLNKCYTILYRKYLNLHIPSKIMIIYFFCSILSVAISGLAYQHFYKNILHEQVSNISVQTLYSIEANIDALINDVNHYSKMILSHGDIQNILKNPTLYEDTSYNRRVNHFLTNILEARYGISSIYILDINEKKYGVDKSYIKNILPNSIQQAPWYEEVKEKTGRYTLSVNAGNIFDNLDKDEHYVSFIRTINDLNTFKPIGTLIINISTDAFKKSYERIRELNLADIAIFTDDHKEIIRFDDTALRDNNMHRIKVPTTDSYNGIEYLITPLTMENHPWKLISAIPLDALSENWGLFRIVPIMLIILNTILLLIGALIVSKLITGPINRLLISMKGIKEGKFEKVDLDLGKDEIGRLKDSYNLMIEEIQDLISRIITEQKFKRKAELRVLQAQIKPHFLYNTIDSLSYLALTKQTDRLYDALEALGTYYRISLSKGNEIITLAQELDIVKNYLHLQKLRYGDMFDVSYTVDEVVLNYKTLKLILQPLVENALYHGIKPKGGKGMISVGMISKDNTITLWIKDDGIGMSSEQVNHLLHDTVSAASPQSYGLKKTLERLQIFYDDNLTYRIESQPNKGTSIYISILKDGNQLHTST